MPRSRLGLAGQSKSTAESCKMKIYSHYGEAFGPPFSAAVGKDREPAANLGTIMVSTK